MKINSSDVVMSSQHSFSRTEIQSETSFESFIQLDTSTQNDACNDSIDASTSVQNSADVNNNTKQDEQRTLDAIIKELIQSLSLNSKNASMSSDDIMKEVDGAIGYSHLSIYSRYEEHESVSISTMASINTEQGSMDLNLNYSMSRDFVYENQIDIYSLTDPLAINLDGGLPSLSTDTFNFDIDNDGESDQISKLMGNSGYLALDKNEDGVINQGSELFGTQTGDGFGELSNYDEDFNGWIDENDSIFDKLQIWLKNDANDDADKELIGLGEVGIGAIYLGNTKSDFTFKTEDNQTLGKLKNSGFYLNDDLTAGSIAQIDLSKTQQQTQKSPLVDLLKE
ncbi:MAG: hypothetical protein ABGW74_09575 [Campylobacterales bacterium]